MRGFLARDKEGRLWIFRLLGLALGQRPLCAGILGFASVTLAWGGEGAYSEGLNKSKATRLHVHGLEHDVANLLVVVVMIGSVGACGRGPRNLGRRNKNVTKPTT